MSIRRERIDHEYDGRFMGPKLILELHGVDQRKWHRILGETGRNQEESTQDEQAEDDAVASE